jgi:hypothetical protein
MKKLLAVLALVGAGAGTTIVYAQDPPTAPPTKQAPAQGDHGMMMGGNMSGMMERMNRMMDACEKMMQTKAPERPKG